MNIYTFLTCLMLFTSSYLAAQTRYHLDCDTAQNNVNLIGCTAHERERADADLQKRLELLFHKIETRKESSRAKDSVYIANLDKLVQLIKSSQERWIDYLQVTRSIRDNLWQSGTGHGPAVNTNETQLIRERILEIDDLIGYFRN